MAEQLIPPDLKRCQAVRVNGRSFMAFGYQLTRCTAAPKYLARDPMPPHGVMSLCEECATICQQQVPAVVFTFIL